MTITDVDLDKHTGFLLAEEAALKRHLSDIEIPSPKGNIPVEVFFRWPSSERRTRGPFVTIDLISITPAYDKWHSHINEYDVPSTFEGPTSSREGQYYPSITYDATPNEESDYHASNFHPYNLMFQITTSTRSVLQDRWLTAHFLTHVLPPRSFWIGVDADHVWRRCELLEWIPGDTLESTEATKSIFRKIYTLNLETEIPTSTVAELVKVERLHVDIYDDIMVPLTYHEHDDDVAHESTLDYFVTE